MFTNFHTNLPVSGQSTRRVLETAMTIFVGNCCKLIQKHSSAMLICCQVYILYLKQHANAIKIVLHLTLQKQMGNSNPFFWVSATQITHSLS